MPTPSELDTLLQFRMVITPSPVYRANSQKVLRIRWIPEVWHVDRGEVWQGEAVGDHAAAYAAAEAEWQVIVEAAFRNEFEEWYDDLPPAERKELDSRGAIQSELDRSREK
ncbi:MAG TPA: hypothetical protein VN084_07635 [Methylophilaceae bacterium]|nr:hypothetical protein [Methylophilaceae bacterium]